MEIDKDTDSFYQQLLLSKSGEERLLMGFSMMDMVKKIIISSLEKNTKKNIKREIFKRLYEKDFSSQEQKIIFQKF